MPHRGHTAARNGAPRSGAVTRRNGGRRPPSGSMEEPQRLGDVLGVGIGHRIVSSRRGPRATARRRPARRRTSSHALLVPSAEPSAHLGPDVRLGLELASSTRALASRSLAAGPPRRTDDVVALGLHQPRASMTVSSATLQGTFRREIDILPRTSSLITMLRRSPRRGCSRLTTSAPEVERDQTLAVRRRRCRARPGSGPPARCGRAPPACSRAAPVPRAPRRRRAMVVLITAWEHRPSVPSRPVLSARWPRIRFAGRLRCRGHQRRRRNDDGQPGVVSRMA